MPFLLPRSKRRVFVAQLLKRAGVGIQVTQGFQQQGIDIVVLCVVFHKTIDQFSKVKAAGHMPEVGADMQEVLASLRLGYDVEVASQRQLQLGATEQIDVAGHFADRTACAFSDSMKFAFGGSEEGENTISFPKIGVLEYNGFSGIAVRLPHGETPYIIKKT